MLLLNFRAKKPLSQKGFSMMEVLVAILTLTLFLTGTLQLVAIDALYKMRGKQEAQAQFWIQEDLEQILALANQSGNTNLQNTIWYNAACLPEMRTTGKGYAENYVSFAKALQNEIEKRSDPKLVGEEYLLPGASPKKLLAQDGVSQNSKTYRMDRTYSITVEEPSVLKINYKVIDVDAEKKVNNDINKSDDYVIATHYAEVIPNESFKCR